MKPIALLRTTVAMLPFLGAGTYVATGAHLGKQAINESNKIQQTATDLGISTEAANILRLRDSSHEEPYSEQELKGIERLGDELKAAATKIRLSKQQ